MNIYIYIPISTILFVKDKGYTLKSTLKIINMSYNIHEKRKINTEFTKQYICLKLTLIEVDILCMRKTGIRGKIWF